jgi:putative membrane protein
MKTRSTILPAITVSILFLVLSGAMIAQDNSAIGDSPFLRRMQSTPAASTKKMSDKDVQFISRVAGHNESEIAYGKMAESKAQSAAVKRIAAQLVNDHTRMNKDLVALGEKKGLKLNPGATKAEAISGNFDKSYLQMVETEQQDRIAEFQKAAASANDSDLRAWAARNLPTLKAHLAMVRDASKGVK